MVKLRGKAALAAGTSLIGMLLAMPALAQDAPADGGSNADIIVTATKLNEALRDVPASISAVTEQDLDRLNAQSLSDYITRVPGVVFNDYQPGVSEVVIRGIASTTYHEANQSTTGYYLNQIPLIEPGFPLAIPDIDTFDLKQVEILRGPQGTLFGSSSLGGAVNYVPNEADPTALDVGFEGFLSSTKRAGQANYAAKAMVNVPIVQDKLAVRLVALQRFDAGYLDNTLAGIDGSNDLRVRGLRGSLVWTPAEGTKVSATSMYQEYDLDDQTYVLFGVDGNGNFAPAGYDRATNVPEYQDTEVMLHSLRLDQDLGDAAKLTALGSYVRKKNDLRFDDSIFLGNDARTGTPQLSGSAGKSETWYGEVRLASAGDGPFTWLVGANYTKLKSNGTDLAQIAGIAAYIDAHPAEYNNQSSSLIAPGDLVSRTVNSNDVQEIAAFGEVSYTFADVLTVTAGGRLFQYKSQPRLQFLPNALIPPVTPFDYQPGKKKESDFIPKLSIRYKPSDSFMVYALYSEGFRIGGINVYSQAANTPLSFNSDSTKNYEIGTRFDLVPGMSFNVSAYHIKWDNIQARLFTPVTFNAYTVNGGGAKIDGLEALLDFRPTPWLSFTNSVSYNKARLSELLIDSFAAGGGYAKGTTLPGASKWTIANQLQVDLKDSPLHPRFGIAHRYVSKAPVAFGSVLQKGDYSIVDLNASIDVMRGIEVGAFVQNLFNTYGVLNAPFSFAGSVTRPRTIGATLRFDLN